MSQEKTLAIIKPDAVGRNLIGSIIKIIEDNNIIISEMKMLTLSKSQAEEFYEVHKDKEFYDGLITYMTSGPIVVMLLTGLDVIKRYRDLMGTTNPKKADKGTIRDLYAINTTQNSVHGSDSPDNAIIEINLFF
tara:strand:+ start:918 stop:1319 length:402 start_codon:yes stop_codon:yes gene_type:complete